MSDSSMGFIREREAFGMAEIFVRKFGKECLPKNIDWFDYVWEEVVAIKNLNAE